MANSLTNKTPANTYKDLLHLNNGNFGADATLRNLVTGDGQQIPIKVSTDKVEINSNEGEITDPIIRNLATKFFDIGTVTTSLASETMSVTMDISNGNLFKITINAGAEMPNINFIINTNHTASNNPALEVLLIIDRQDVFTYSSVTWPAGLKWAGGDSPTEVIFNNAGTGGNIAGEHIIKFISPDNGTTWYGFVVGTFFSVDLF